MLPGKTHTFRMDLVTGIGQTEEIERVSKDDAHRLRFGVPYK